MHSRPFISNMSAREAWELLESLLNGAKGAGTIEGFQPVETGVQDVPIRFWVIYSDPGSVDCSNLNNEIQSFGYQKLHAEGAKWYYGIPKRGTPLPRDSQGEAERLTIKPEDVRGPDPRRERKPTQR